MTTDTRVTLDAKQKMAKGLILAPDRNAKIIGYAGTGKTTVLGAAAKMDFRAILLAPTNKAAAVLTPKTGRPVATIHKTTHVAMEVWNRELGVHEIKFVPKNWDAVPGDHKIVVDEAAMIGTSFWREALDVLGRHRKVVMVGDGFQLPPIGDSSAFDQFMSDGPSMDVVELTRVYRQEGESPVLDFATRLRQGEHVNLRDSFSRIDPTSHEFLAAAFHGAAVCISYRNDVRMGNIRRMREKLWGTPYAPPQKGEPMIAYSSSPVHPLKNGFRATMLEDATVDIDGTWKCKLKAEDGSEVVDWISPEEALDPNQKRNWYVTKEGAPITFGYAMTAHAAQGSEWPIVAVENFNPLDRDGARWLYTAVTRAQEEVYAI